jgi:hypothetical protein
MPGKPVQPTDKSTQDLPKASVNGDATRSSPPPLPMNKGDRTA